MSRFLFVTDLHINTVCAVRTGNPLDDVLQKLRWCVAKANELDATLLLGGDIFDKATVPYEAVNGVMDVLSGCRYTALCVWGNHDMLYRADENARRCALYTLGASGTVGFIDNTVVSYPDCYVGGQLPLETRDKPQLLVYHGFLEQKDGRFTVSVSDLVGCSSPALVLLGHDHVEYADYVVNDHIAVVRPGSLFRNRRVSTSDRVPKAVYVEVENGSIRHSLLEVSVARSASDIFSVSGSMPESVTSSDSSTMSYDTLLELLRNSSGGDGLSFMDALRMVAPDDVVSYCEGILGAASVQKKGK